MQLSQINSCSFCHSQSQSFVAKGPDFEYRCAPDEFSMVSCDECGLVFLNPRPAASELATIYPSSYIPYRFDDYLPPIVNQARMMLQRSKVKALRKLTGPRAVIWDVGCGNGLLLDCLRKMGPKTWQLTGVDISGRALECVRQRGFETVEGRFEELTLPAESVDVIILNQVIEHFEDPSAVVAKAFSVLKKGGHLFIETPCLEGWDARLFRSRYWGGWHFPRHWTLFNQSTLRRLLEKNEFRVHSLEWMASPTFWVQSVHHWLVDHGVSERVAGLIDCRNPFIMAFFTGVDWVQKFFGHTSNMRMVGQK